MYPASEVSLSGVSSNEPSQKFGIVVELGQGGMSIVHLATSRNLGNVQKLVVLKSIRPEMMSNEKVRRMFMDEARLAIRLTHPNIVQTYEVVTIGEWPVIVMEYMEGQALSHVQRAAHEQQASGGLSLAMKLRVIIDALSGMQYAHELSDYDGRPLGLVHRDISPQNVFVTYDGHVKILDFGIAKVLDGSGLTEVGEIKGKIRYMPPEQMQGAVDLDRRADVYALGVMLWEALTGKRLWHGVSDVEVFRTVLHRGIPNPRSVAPDVNPRLEEICLKAVARDPAARYESCAAMQADLERACDELGLSASNRQLGQLVQALFAERRLAIRRAIERRLKGNEGAPSDVTFTGVTSSSHLGARASQRTSTTAIELSLEEPKRRWPLVAIVLLFALGGGGWAAVSRNAQWIDPRGHAAKPPDPAPESASPALPPVDAGVLVDEAARASPFVAALPPAARAVPKPAARRALTAKAAPGTSASAAPASADCERPFLVDASGIRRVRPECL